ncbi:uncharacterized protein EV154DRAFT_187057 [Mucor mucedo]|uniref:uncharacterized protein n=1 Tax=Mucor mucedo TaxID=29922 RepID=UPI0022204944|nr:uncharacterized protein EV154DRAFT_187057 [Mucor mucedo]KAI7892674.1 hypothetical protein EV154DRAFT_187057 [Mucor mucedo]
MQSEMLPTSNVDCKEKFKNITNMMWELKTGIDNSHDLLQEIKESHETNRWLVDGRLEGYQKVGRLDDLLADSVEVKLSSRVSEADLFIRIYLFIRIHLFIQIHLLVQIYPIVFSKI